MTLDEKRTFLFRCDDCQMVLSVDFEDKEDIEDIQNDKIELECPCHYGKCKVLRD